MTNYEKIAVLLGELGNGAADAVLDKLKLSTEQVIKIKKAMKQIRGYGDKVYDPMDPAQVNRELSVLEDLKTWGELHGIYREVPHTGLIKTVETPQDRMANMAAMDPEAFAKVIGQMLASD